MEIRGGKGFFIKDWIKVRVIYNYFIKSGYYWCLDFFCGKLKLKVEF